MRNTHGGAYRTVLARLVAARQDAGLTQTDVAKALRWPQSRVSRMETGERRIDIIELRDLAALYRRPITHFVPKR